MRSKDLPPASQAVYQQILAAVHAEMDKHGMTGRQRLEVLSMACADLAKIEGPDCFAFIEGVFQKWMEDLKDDSAD